MSMRMSYQKPNYRTYRERMGIQTWRSVRVPAGYTTEILNAVNETDLREKIKFITFYETHDHTGRPLTLNDLKIVEWT